MSYDGPDADEEEIGLAMMAEEADEDMSENDERDESSADDSDIDHQGEEKGVLQ